MILAELVHQFGITNRFGCAGHTKRGRGNRQWGSIPCAPGQEAGWATWSGGDPPIL